MTDLIALAKQAGFDLPPYYDNVDGDNYRTKRYVLPDKLQAFADLIRKDEREKCDELKNTIQCQGLIGAHPEYIAGKEMAVSQFSAAIRARTTT